MNIIVNLYGNADAVALSDTEITGKRNLVLKMIFLYGFLQKLHNFGRAFKMAGATHANLNDHILHLSLNAVLEELINSLRGNGVELLVDGHAYALLALADAEGAAHLNLITEVILSDESLKALYNESGTFDVAGTADTNNNFHFDISFGLSK